MEGLTENELLEVEGGVILAVLGACAAGAVLGYYSGAALAYMLK